MFWVHRTMLLTVCITLSFIFLNSKTFIMILEVFLIIISNVTVLVNMQCHKWSTQLQTKGEGSKVNTVQERKLGSIHQQNKSQGWPEARETGRVEMNTWLRIQQSSEGGKPWALSRAKERSFRSSSKLKVGLVDQTRQRALGDLTRKPATLETIR